MKILIGLLCLSVLAACSQQPSDKIVGEWDGTLFDGKKISLTFNEDNSARIIKGAVVTDDQSIDGKVVWKLDSSVDPHHLDISILTKTGSSATEFKEEARLASIVRFIGEDRLLYRLSDQASETRPTEFSDDDTEPTQFILARKK